MVTDKYLARPYYVGKTNFASGAQDGNAIERAVVAGRAPRSVVSNPKKRQILRGSGSAAECSTARTSNPLKRTSRHEQPRFPRHPGHCGLLRRAGGDRLVGRQAREEHQRRLLPRE